MGGWQGPMPTELLAEFEAAGHPWLRAPERLPAPDGSLRKFEYAASAQACARLGAGTMVCGITGLPGFRADILARLWAEQLNDGPCATEIMLTDTPAAGWSPVSLASRLERMCDDVANTLAERARQSGAIAIIFPAILGIERSTEVRAALQQATGLTIAEALS